MNIQVLNRAQAFGPGAKLWVIPPETEFPFHHRLNWYLNFQLSRAKHYRAEELSAPLRNIISLNQLPPGRPPRRTEQPVMVVAERYFPAQIVVELPGAKDLKKWLKQLTTLWEDLQLPEMRVFLPESVSTDEFQSQWKGGKDDLISLVPG